MYVFACNDWVLWLYSMWLTVQFFFILRHTQLCATMYLPFNNLLRELWVNVEGCVGCCWWKTKINKLSQQLTTLLFKASSFVNTSILLLLNHLMICRPNEFSQIRNWILKSCWAQMNIKPQKSRAFYQCTFWSSLLTQAFPLVRKIWTGKITLKVLNEICFSFALVWDKLSDMFVFKW